MSRWYIFKESEDAIGPLTSEQIRYQLRQGAIDPFDLVAFEGSTIRRQLLEVDEIFSQADQLDEQAAEPVPDSQGDKPHTNISQSFDSAHGHVLTQAGNILGRGQLHLAMQLEPESSRAPGPLAQSPPQLLGERLLNHAPAQVEPKVFYLSSGKKNRSAGPYAAAEIVQMFRGKAVPPRLMVLKLGLHQKPVGEVSLDRFMKLYGQRAGVRRVPPYRRDYEPTSTLALRVRHGEQIAKDRQVFLTVLALLMFLAAGMIIGFGVLRHQRQPKLIQGFLQHRATEKARSTGSRSRSKGKEANEKSRPAGKSLGTDAARKTAPRNPSQTKSVLTPLLNSSQKDSEKNPPTQIKPKQSAKQAAQEHARELRLKAREARVQARLAARQAAAREEKARDKEKSQKAKRREKKALSGPKIVNAPAASPAPKPPPAPAPPAPTSGLVNGGMAQNYGPLGCPKPAISACEGSCTISCNGPQGSVTIMFFKGVWGAKIDAKSSAVYVSGFVRVTPGSGPRIIVSGVK